MSDIYSVIRNMSNRQMVALLEANGEIILPAMARSASALSEVVRSKFQEMSISAADIRKFASNRVNGVRA